MNSENIKSKFGLENLKSDIIFKKIMNIMKKVNHLTL